MASGGQVTKMQTRLRMAGFETHETRHAFVGEVIGHSYARPGDLTKQEASDVIEALKYDELRPR